MLSVRLKGVYSSHDPPQNMLVGQTVLQGTVITSLYTSEFVHLPDCQHPPNQYLYHRNEHRDPNPVSVGPKKSAMLHCYPSTFIYNGNAILQCSSIISQQIWGKETQFNFRKQTSVSILCPHFPYEHSYYDVKVNHK